MPLYNADGDDGDNNDTFLNKAVFNILKKSQYKRSKPTSMFDMLIGS